MSAEAYAAAEIVFLDRESGVKTAMAYPVTEVILRSRDDPTVVQARYVADEQGNWQAVPFPGVRA